MMKRTLFLLCISYGTVTIAGGGGLAALYQIDAVPQNSPTKSPLKKKDSDWVNKRVLLDLAKESNFCALDMLLRQQYAAKPELIYVCDSQDNTIFDYFIIAYKAAHPEAKKEYFSTWLQLVDPLSELVVEIGQNVADNQELLAIFNRFVQKSDTEVKRRADAEKNRQEAEAEAHRLKARARQAREVAKRKAEAYRKAVEREEAEQAYLEALEQQRQEAEKAEGEKEEKKRVAKLAQDAVEVARQMQQLEEELARDNRLHRVKPPDKSDDQKGKKPKTKSKSKHESKKQDEGGFVTVGKVSLGVGAILALIAGKRFIDQPQLDTEGERKSLSDIARAA